MRNITDLFKLAGGSIHIASALNINQFTVERWARSGIPIKYWDKLIKLYKVSVADLYEISRTLKE